MEGSDGNFYGASGWAAEFGGGERFIDSVRGRFLRFLHDFADGDGHSPVGGLMEGSDGLLYGTAEFGGQGEAGVSIEWRRPANSRCCTRSSPWVARTRTVA